MRIRSRQAGLTLVETVVSMTLMTVIVGGVVSSTARGMAAVRTSTASAEITARSGRAMTRILQEVEALGATSLSPDLITGAGLPIESSPSIQFRSGDNWQAGNIVWSTDTRVRFQTDSNELENGVDDDGDGLIDEGAVVLTLDVGGAEERNVTIATGVRGYLDGEILNGLDDNGNGVADERGLVFTRVNNVLSIELTMESTSPDGGVLVRNLRNSIRIRN